MKRHPEIVIEDRLHRVRAPLLSLALLSAFLALSWALVGELLLFGLPPLQGRIISGIENISPHWALNPSRANLDIIVGRLVVEYKINGELSTATPWILETWRRYTGACKGDEPLDTERPLRRHLQEALRSIDSDPNCFQILSPPDRFQTGNQIPLLRVPGLGIVLVAHRKTVYLPALLLLFLGLVCLGLFGIQFACSL